MLIKNTSKIYLFGALLILFAITSNANASKYNVILNYQLSQEILLEVCSGNEINEEKIVNSKIVLDMVKHFSKFRDYFTLENYVDSRRQAALCEKNDKDYFRFNALIDNKEDILRKLNQLKAIDINQIANSLTPFVKNNTKTSTAYVMVATPSCGGWAIENDFYVDFPCIKDDIQGLSLLIKHELFHVVNFDKQRGETYIEQLFKELVEEGSATAIADFSKLENTSGYSEKSKKEYKKNSARMSQNFDLLEIFIGSLNLSNSSENYQRIYNIGFSGVYDSPMYYIGYQVFITLEKSYGLPKVACLLKYSPLSMLTAYDRLTEDDETLPRFGTKTKKAISRFEWANQCHLNSA